MSVDNVKGLHGLRGLAAFAVLGVHYNQMIGVELTIGPFELERWLANGEYGVALFFILSGFLISLPFWRAQYSGVSLPAIRPYLWRRLARILPAYYTALTLLVITSEQWRLPGAQWDIGLHYLLLHNMAEFSVLGINPPFWSLAVEVQFYVLLPLLFLISPSVKILSRLMALLAFGCAAYLGYFLLADNINRVYYWPFDLSLQWFRPFGAVLNYSLPAHLPHFIIGVIFSLFYLELQSAQSKKPRSYKAIAEVTFWIASGLVSVLLSTNMEHWVQIPYGRYGLPIIPLLLAIIVLSAPFTSLALRLLESRLVYGAGVLSYGVYIYHYPVFSAIYQWMGARGMDPSLSPYLFGLSGVTITLSLAWISWVSVEKPAIGWVRRRQLKSQRDTEEERSRK